MIIGRQLVEDQYEEKLYSSTGDDYLDELLEKAFCEGYEYAQKEFAIKLKNPADALSTAQKVARKRLGGTGRGYRMLPSSVTADQLDATTLRVLKDAGNTSAVKKLVRQGTGSGLIAKPSI